jgi:sorbitol-specific phosphotransferase system component IIBC
MVGRLRRERLVSDQHQFRTPNLKGDTHEVYEYEQECESMEMELASELLSVRNEQELEQFLGDILKGVGKVLGPVGNAVGGVLKSVAKTALPVVGGALGTMVAPGIGTAIGSQLGNLASGALGEYELSRA